jgi:hypothetical protein
MGVSTAFSAALLKIFYIMNLFPFFLLFPPQTMGVSTAFSAALLTIF